MKKVKYIHLDDLDGLSVLFNNNFRFELFSKIAIQFKNQKDIAKVFGVRQWTISRWKTGKSFVPISKLNLIREHSQTNSLEKGVNKIGGGKGSEPLNIRLPLEFSENLSYLCGLIITDGHLNKNLRWVQFTNKSKYLQKIFLKKIKDVFKYNKYYQNEKDRIQIYIKSKNITIIFHCIDIPKGRKVGIITVPDIVKKSPSSVKAAFLRGCFDGDGSVSYSKKRGLRIINLANRSKKFLEEIQVLLKEFGIESSLTTNKFMQSYLNITNKSNLNKFHNSVGFHHPERKEKLSTLLLSYQRP
ncbi:MAG: LAGLIDADG family homing endonuclease [Candidatus Aenigmatarchaeota archaeon]